MTAALPPIVVLLGGPSAEHDVSIVSGSAIADALEAAGHAVDRILIDLDGGWWRLPAAGHRGEPATTFDDPRSLGAAGPMSAGAAVDELAARDPAPVVFIALHGPFGEDGTVQAILEAAGLAVHRLRGDRIGARDGQGDLQAAGPWARPPGRRLARGVCNPLGR